MSKWISSDYFPFEISIGRIRNVPEKHALSWKKFKRVLVLKPILKKCQLPFSLPSQTHCPQQLGPWAAVGSELF